MSTLEHLRDGSSPFSGSVSRRKFLFLSAAFITKVGSLVFSNSYLADWLISSSSQSRSPRPFLLHWPCHEKYNASCFRPRRLFRHSILWLLAYRFRSQPGCLDRYSTSMQGE